MQSRLPLKASCFIFVFLFGQVVASQPLHTVFWISVDGLRPDYIERADTRVFDYLRAQGAFSDEVWPVFPSGTFPSHVSQVTGVSPEKHGITGNSFYDSRTGRILRYPGDAELLEAEPIWITAARQGVRAAVLDWPLSHNQRGPVRAAFFEEEFQRGLSDEDRLTRTLDLWEKDQHEEPLRLIMGYVLSPDTAGHRHGPDSPEIDRAVERTDAVLGRAFRRAREIWEGKGPGPEDRFFLVITSDHGMSKVDTLVHPGHLTGLEGRNDIVIVATGNVAHIHLNRVPRVSERRRIINTTLARLAEFHYVTAYRRHEIPARWGYRHPARTGDILLVLKKGYTFSRRTEGMEMSAREAGGPLGMHGYDPVTNPEMLTPLFIYRTPDPIGGLRLGKADALQIHATVSGMLGIEPATGALRKPIEWEPVVTP